MRLSHMLRDRTHPFFTEHGNSFGLLLSPLHFVLSCSFLVCAPPRLPVKQRMQKAGIAFPSSMLAKISTSMSATTPKPSGAYTAKRSRIFSCTNQETVVGAERGSAENKAEPLSEKSSTPTPRQALIGLQVSLMPISVPCSRDLKILLTLRVAEYANMFAAATVTTGTAAEFFFRTFDKNLHVKFSHQLATRDEPYVNACSEEQSVQHAHCNLMIPRFRKANNTHSLMHIKHTLHLTPVKNSTI
jgi:hypothetical protein